MRKKILFIHSFSFSCFFFFILLVIQKQSLKLRAGTLTKETGIFSQKCHVLKKCSMILEPEVAENLREPV